MLHGSAASWLRHRQAAPRVKPLQQRLRLLGHNVALLHAVKCVAGRQLSVREWGTEGMRAERRHEGRENAGWWQHEGHGLGERCLLGFLRGRAPPGWGRHDGMALHEPTHPHEACHPAIGHVMPTHADCPRTINRPCPAHALEPTSMPAHQVMIKPRTSKKPGWRASSLGPSSTKWRNASCRYTVHMSGTCGGAWGMTW